MGRVVVNWWVMMLVSACAGGAPEPSQGASAGSRVAAASGEERPPPPSKEAALSSGAGTDASSEAVPSHGRIRRATLTPILDAGLGRFLQGVEIEPVTRDGEFVGFRLERLWPGDARFEDVELQPGDVIVGINGQAIERPEQAHRVWTSLRVASQLVIEFLRDGERRELRYAIVGQ